MRVRLACALPAVEESRRAVASYLADFSVDDRTTFQLEVILEELVSNVVRHARQANEVIVAASYDQGNICLTVEDDGAAFNPLDLPEPAPFASLHEANLGGLGVSMVRKLARGVSYERIDRLGMQCNRVTVELSRTDPAE